LGEDYANTALNWAKALVLRLEWGSHRVLEAMRVQERSLGALHMVESLHQMQDASPYLRPGSVLKAKGRCFP
jgi:hypothetical protein